MYGICLKYVIYLFREDLAMELHTWRITGKNEEKVEKACTDPTFAFLKM